MKIFKFYIILFITTFIQASAPVLIMTYVYNRPDFIDLHVKTFNAFLQDEYRYVVFNDASNENMRKQIEQTCARLKIECFRVPDHNADRINKPGWRHMDGIKYSLEQIGFKHNGPVIIIDADMFLIKPLNIKEYMQDYDFIACMQFRENNNIKVTYAGPFVVIMNMNALPNKYTLNFDGGNVEGLACDTGGHTYYYLRNNPTIKKFLYNVESTGNINKDFNHLAELGFNKNDAQFIVSLLASGHNFEFHVDRNFLHFYAGGSNWAGYSASFLQEKTAILNAYIDHCISFYKK